MAIQFGYALPSSSKQRNAKTVKPSQATPKNQTATTRKRVYNVTWVTPECAPFFKAGGLGGVSQTIPDGMNQHADIDARVIMPGVKPVVKLISRTQQNRKIPFMDRFHDTGIRMSRRDMHGKMRHFKVMELRKPGPGTFVYSIMDDNQPVVLPKPLAQLRSIVMGITDFVQRVLGVKKSTTADGLFAPYNDLYMHGSQPGRYKTTDEKLNAQLIFGELAGELSMYLGHEKRRSLFQRLMFPNGFHPFSPANNKGQTDALIANDIQSVSAFTEVKNPYTVKVYVLHNQYINDPVTSYKKNGKISPVLPENTARIYGSLFPNENNYNALAWGIKEADAVVACENYAIDLMEGKPSPFVGNYASDEASKVKTNKLSPKIELQWEALKEKEKQGRVYDIHHEAPPSFNPYKTIQSKTEKNPFSNGHDGKPQTLSLPSINAVSRNSQFVSSAQQQPSTEAILKWKQLARKKVHDYLGMPDNPNAVPYMFIGRLDPRQKGTFMILDTIEEFCQTHPDAEFFICIPDLGHVESKQLVERIQKNPALKNKIRFMVGRANQPINEAIAAASVAGLSPSLYEPFGLIQFEYGRMFSVPITTMTSGLLASTNDIHSQAFRDENGYKALIPDIEKYGQTGYHLNLSTEDLVAYRNVQDIRERENIASFNSDGNENPYLVPKNSKDYERKIRRIRSAYQTAQITKKANNAFLDTLDRVYWEYKTDPHSVAAVAQNFHQYINDVHSPENISKQIWQESVVVPAVERKQGSLNKTVSIVG
ncbi:MAG: glycogen/starch synthase [Cyanobacteria bacterium P01_H01_bin.74]